LFDGKQHFADCASRDVCCPDPDHSDALLAKPRVAARIMASIIRVIVRNAVYFDRETR
jgi:hypothetical protein